MKILLLTLATVATMAVQGRTPNARAVNGPGSTGGCVSFHRQPYVPMEVVEHELPKSLRSRLRGAQVDDAEPFDLNCDGTPDYVIRTHGADRTGQLSAYVAETGGWRRVLRAVSDPEGAVQVVLAADLTGVDRLALITLSADEGGYVPRVFVWRDGQYVELRIPLRHIVRHEEEWSPTCIDRIVPRLAGAGRFTLLRETISPTSVASHGADCNLPVDTLTINHGPLQVK